MWMGKTWSQLKGAVRDVTEECDFEWVIEPVKSWAKLVYTDRTGDFSEGEIVQGLTSGATATVIKQMESSYSTYLGVEDVSGSFEVGEIIKGQTSGAEAQISEFVPERAYPDNILHGRFPDSLKTKDRDDYFEVEVSTAGANYVFRLRVNFPEEGLYVVIPSFTVYSDWDEVNYGWYLRVISSLWRFVDATFDGFSLGSTYVRDYVLSPFTRGSSIGFAYVERHPESDSQGVVNILARLDGAMTATFRIYRINVFKLF